MVINPTATTAHPNLTAKKPQTGLSDKTGLTKITRWQNFCR